ncbi:MAG: hypothetical protein IE920_08910, partial [Thiotrichales bacterium]|nr:hypothetical protein [Thiotrichales bacterium]
LAAVCAAVGKIPSVAEYMEAVAKLDTMTGDVYRYLQFDEMADYEVVSPKKLSDIGVAVA